MQALQDLASKFSIAGELLSFLWQAKLWWMIPLVFVMLFLGIIVALGATTGIGPLFYPLF